MLDQNKLNQYGKIFRSYEGEGTLLLKNNVAINCHFLIAQYADANIYLTCKIKEDDAGKTIELEDEIKLSGTTIEGNIIDLSNLICIKNSFHTSLEKKSQDIIYQVKEFTIGNSNLESEKVLYRFFLTNLYKTEISLTLNNYSIKISPVHNYPEVLQNIKAQRIDVTHTAEIEANLPDKDSVIKIVDNLCLLLTLAQGCSIQWISYEIGRMGEKPFYVYHKNAVAKSYGTQTLLLPKSSEAIEVFINETFSKFESIDQKWELRKAILAYNDAKIESDYLEFRALKMTIVLEHLKGIYLEQHDKTFLIDESIFEEIEPYLKNLVASAIQTIFLPKYPETIVKMIADHTQAFKWYPFRKAISDLCDDINLKINSKERGRFVDIRNDLVHRMSFNPKYGSEWEQYTFLMTFVGKILLAILDYEGEFFDWSDKSVKKLDRIL